jgi:hypothetical protein
LLAAALLVGAMIAAGLMLATAPQRGFSIDGRASEWESVDAYKDPTDAPMAASVDEVKWHIEGGWSYFLIRGPAAALHGDSARGDTLRVFLDRDDDPATGYLVRGLGAELLLEVFGGDGKVYGASAFLHDSIDRKDWTGWRPSAGLRAAKIAGDDSVEIGLRVETPPAALAAHALAADGSRDLVGPARWDRTALPAPAPAREPPGPDDRLAVDGHVGDWSKVPRHGVGASPSLAGTGVDIVSTAAAKQDSRDFFLIETAGSALAGDDVPALPYLLSRYVPGGPQSQNCPSDFDCDGLRDEDDPDDDNDGVPDPFDLDPKDPSVRDRWPESGARETAGGRRRGEDRLIVFLDLDGSPATGFRPPWMAIAADAAVEVVGRDGELSPPRFLAWRDDGFAIDSSVVPTAAAWERFVEVSAASGAAASFILAATWDGSGIDSSKGEVGPMGSGGILPLSVFCTIVLNDGDNVGWPATTEAVVDDPNNDAQGPNPKSPRDIDLIRLCNNTMMVYFRFEQQATACNDCFYSVFFDTTGDGADDTAFVFQYNATNRDANDFNDVIDLFNWTGSAWSPVTIPFLDRADSCNACWLEMGLELIYLGTPSSFTYYGTTGTTSPVSGGAIDDRAPDAGWSPSYAVPESSVGGVSLGGLAAALLLLLAVLLSVSKKRSDVLTERRA